MANRVGEDRLYRLAPVQSDVPERSVQRIAPMAPDTGEGWPGHWPRPSRLLQRPEPIETVALLPDHPPVTFTWRGVRRRVKRADGPERVFGEWWKRDAELAAVRDYFQVEDENGERYWVYYSYHVPGSMAWIFSDTRVDIRFNDPSVHRERISPLRLSSFRPSQGERCRAA